MPVVRLLKPVLAASSPLAITRPFRSVFGADRRAAARLLRIVLARILKAFDVQVAADIRDYLPAIRHSAFQVGLSTRLQGIRAFQIRIAGDADIEAAIAGPDAGLLVHARITAARAAARRTETRAAAPLADAEATARTALMRRTHGRVLHARHVQVATDIRDDPPAAHVRADNVRIAPRNDRDAVRTGDVRIVLHRRVAVGVAVRLRHRRRHAEAPIVTLPLSGVSFPVATKAAVPPAWTVEPLCVVWSSVNVLLLWLTPKLSCTPMLGAPGPVAPPATPAAPRPAIAAFSGRWLELAGFEAGQQVRIEVEHGRLVITHD